jgi:hypothetical protein
MISRGDNRPDFDPDSNNLKMLLVSLHLRMPPKAFQETFRWKSEKYQESIEFLKTKGYVYEKDGKCYPSCMVITDKEGKELFEYSEPLARKIADLVISNMSKIQDLYMKTHLSKTTDFSKVSFLILSNVLLDNWQIRNVEGEFLAKERPQRHGKNYYVSFQQNLNSSRESFGIYGNMVFNDLAVFGNNRGIIQRSQQQEYSEKALAVSDMDGEVFNEMASSIRPQLIGLLRKDRNYIEQVFKKTVYPNEITFEEFFIWWYHFIYTRATNILAERGHLTLPEGGNFFYARRNPATASSVTPPPDPTGAISPEVDQILERYAKAVGGEGALLGLSNEHRKGELRTGTRTFTIESRATASGQWDLALKGDQQSLQIQCNNVRCWRNGNPSDPVDPATAVEMAAEFEILFPLHVKDYFPTLRLMGKDTQAGNPVLILEGSSPSLKPTKIIFDVQTGLLVKLGSTEFQDYRECGGIQRPYVFVSTLEGKMTSSEIQHNQPIPPEAFEGQTEVTAQSNVEKQTNR